MSSHKERVSRSAQPVISRSPEKKISVDTLAQEWYRLNQEIKSMTETRDKIKDKLKEAMVKKRVNQLSGERYHISRQERSRRSVSLKSLPKELIDRYATKSDYTVMTVVPIRSAGLPREDREPEEEDHEEENDED